MLSLTLGAAPAASARSCRPRPARTTRRPRPRWSAPPATRRSTVGDPSIAATGHLVNGTFQLSQPLQVRATNAANATGTFGPLTSPVNLLTYTGPTAGADDVTMTFRQAIAANEVLRSGSYSKTLTFTLSTTQP